ncbi:hypothetical protein [Marinobacterium lutimaris]|uniref:Uncharacterized protein n=1 Tax=Marinobacterium lutimaris TaxID=568106 RepID=A0A1H5XPJ9_9GAMM|nr:hypothetical protein [Marinobacterium lutimaris]SEG13280.1 hypothetical protein SAMN05444390_1011448 [Marinobacterium lutimaris]
MSDGKKCLKCGFVNQQEEAEACPDCGAYYAKVEAHLNNTQSNKPDPRPSAGPSQLEKFSKALVAAKEAPAKAKAEARQSQNTLVRNYKGKQEEAFVEFQKDAALLEAEGFEPVNQVWIPGSWGCGSFLVALALCLLIIGILVFIYMIIVKPAGTLTVTYRRKSHSQDSAA